MIELAVRIGIAGAATTLAGLAGSVTFAVAWKVAAVFGAYSFLLQRLEARGLRNAGIAGIAAVMDALCIAALLGAVGVLEHAGFLVLAPCAYAAAGFGSLPTAMAPMAAASLMASHAWFVKDVNPPAALYLQIVGVLIVGLLLNHRRIVVTLERPVEIQEPTKEGVAEPEAYLALRESFRRLRDAYRSLDSKSRRDRLAVELFEVRHAEGERFMNRLAMRLRELAGADSLVLYTLSQVASTMTIRAFAGDPPHPIREASFPVDLQAAPALLRESSEQALASLTTEADRTRIANVLLRHRGRVLGLVCVVVDDPDRLPAVRTQAEDLAPFVAAAISEEQEIERSRLRARRAELLYDIATVTLGADTLNSLAARAVSELASLVEADHLAIAWLEGAELQPAATHGEPVRFLDCISFSEGAGIEGWLKVGAPEIAMFDTADDIRCTPADAVKRRVRSFLLVPLCFDGGPFGVLLAASRRAHGLQAADLETLRLVGGELSHALARIVKGDVRPSGLATPMEFRRHAASASHGWLVRLEPLRKQQILEDLGAPCFRQAIREYARRVRTKLPAGSLITVHADGDVIALLTSCTEGEARSWANEAAAIASFIGVPVDGWDRRVPLAFRAKVAPMGEQDARTELAAAS